MISKPRTFIGSSKEGIKYAHALQAGLDDKLECTAWDQSVFDLSASTVDALVAEAERSEFAILVFSPDDELVIRGREVVAVRDNVLFELGLLMGILGRKRVFVVAPSDIKDFRIPSDLLGLTFANYHQRSDGNTRAALGPACTSILDAVSKVLAADPEPGCAYVHTEETSHVIPIGKRCFSVVFQPPMRATPVLRFLGSDDASISNCDVTHWTRYGFTVTLPEELERAKFRFVALARP